MIRLQLGHQHTCRIILSIKHDDRAEQRTAESYQFLKHESGGHSHDYFKATLGTPALGPDQLHLIRR